MAMLQQLVVTTQINQQEPKQCLGYVTTPLEQTDQCMEQTDKNILHTEAAILRLEDGLTACELSTTTDPAFKEQLEQLTKNQLCFEAMLNERPQNLEKNDGPGDGNSDRGNSGSERIGGGSSGVADRHELQEHHLQPPQDGHRGRLREGTRRS